MKHFYVLFGILLISNITMAQHSQPIKSKTDGFYLGIGLLAAGWNTPDLNTESESGGGLGLRAGYNFSQNFGLYLSIDGSSINPSTGDNYGLGHFDLGVEGILGNPFQQIRPFARASYLGMAAVYDNPSGDVEMSGVGFGLGAGIHFFISSSLSLELSYNRSWVNLSEVKVGSQSTEVDEDAVSGRFMIGTAFRF